MFFSDRSGKTSYEGVTGVQTCARPIYVDIAKRHGLDPAQMALAFVRRQPFVASTLLGATTMAQLQANVESLQLELSEEVLAEIEAVHQVYTYPAP